MASIIISAVGERKETPRIWFEGEKLNREGFRVGEKYLVDDTRDDRLVLVRVKDDPDARVVSFRKRNGKLVPIIDINNKSLAKWFEVSQKLRIAIRRGKIIITKHILTGQVAARLEKARKALSERRKLAVHSHYHGAGVLDLAIHSGFARAGVGSFVQVAIEKERDYLDISLSRNPELFTPDSILIQGGVEEVIPDSRVPCDVFLAGLPCLGASVAGRAKMRHVKGESRTYLPEEHDTAGSLFFYTLNHIIASQPWLVILENVKAYSSSASMAVIRSVLSSAGYVVSERVLGGNEFGALEDRERLCVVAVTKGLEDVVDLTDVQPLMSKPDTLGEVLDDIPADSSMWRKMEYLAKKEKRDIADGKGFRRQLFTGEESRISTITRQYQKRRSTDPMILHPDRPELSRLLTPEEHCRCKGIPLKLIDDPAIATGTKHEVLGQSVIFPAFEAVGYALARQLSALISWPSDSALAA
ncbi:DNA cytosine methyltransferase [Marinobacter alkaliphilus]|uniref:DNA cytosine methyltransferase n=1 Tax=Marinobacter alkaliphilus TaxID=254719 RepID=A0ABZ3E902_9GAMM